MNRSQTIEDLHNQLQMNVEANQQLNQRVSLRSTIYFPGISHIPENFLHSRNYTYYIIYYILYVICYMLYVICYMLYVICYMLYVIYYILYICRLSYLQINSLGKENLRQRGIIDRERVARKVQDIY